MNAFHLRLKRILGSLVKLIHQNACTGRKQEYNNIRSRKKIVCVHHGRSIGGASLELLYLLQKTDKKIYHPKVLFLKNSDVVQMFRAENIDVRVVRTWRGFSHTEGEWIKWYRPDLIIYALIALLATAFFGAKKILREEKPDLVHLNSLSLPGWAVAAKRLRIPVVCHAREPIQKGYLGVRRALVRSILEKNVDQIIAVSKQNARVLDIPNKTKVIYGFVHFQQFDRQLKPYESLLQTDHSNKYALYLGGAATIKGFEVVVRALKYLEPGIHVIFGGYYRSGTSWKDPLRRVLKPGLHYIYETLNSSSNAVKIGVMKDVPRWIAACDVLISPFTVPHFSRPVIEAGAMAKPVIASDLDGMEEIVVDGETGILVPAGDARRLAQAINRLCRDQQLAQSMGKAGYKRTKALFDGEKNTKATFDVFEKLLNTCKAGRPVTSLLKSWRRA